MVRHRVALSWLMAWAWRLRRPCQPSVSVVGLVGTGCGAVLLYAWVMALVGYVVG
ncbi:hypothetical protein [Dermatophilus congolensis]|nr:hypothetical protein [Dermatophilus congolensis]